MKLTHPGLFVLGFTIWASDILTLRADAVNDPPTLDPFPDILVPENAAPQVVALTGIGSGAPNESQTLSVTALSSATSVIPNPTISYTSPNSSGVVLTNATGGATFPDGLSSTTATLTVVDSDGPVVPRLESGVYQTPPGATVEERGDAVPNGSRVMPISATLTLDLSGVPPSLTAVIPNAVLEGGDPFALTVRGSSGARLIDGTYRFSGDYLQDIQPSGTQYEFDWTFSTSTNGQQTCCAWQSPCCRRHPATQPWRIGSQRPFVTSPSRLPQMWTIHWNARSI